MYNWLNKLLTVSYFPPLPALPTFYEIKAEHLPPFGKKKRGRFLYLKNIALRWVFYLPVTQNEPIFSVLTSPNSTEITKLVLNINTSICLCIWFVMASKVRKKRKNLKINRKRRSLKEKLRKSGRFSTLSEYLAGLHYLNYALHFQRPRTSSLCPSTRRLPSPSLRSTP